MQAEPYGALNESEMVLVDMLRDTSLSSVEEWYISRSCSSSL